MTAHILPDIKEGQIFIYFRNIYISTYRCNICFIICQGVLLREVVHGFWARICRARIGPLG